MVALLTVSIPWLEFFKNLLTAGEDGVVAVLKSACPKSLELNGLGFDENLLEICEAQGSSRFAYGYHSLLCLFISEE
eukprot:scaffold5747_cov126-Cylindrotheca_fusiformis.AAC.2